MRKSYSKALFTRGKHKNWLKEITFYMPPRKEQQGKSTTFPMLTKFGFVDIVVPNIIGIKEITVKFDYSEKYQHPF